MADKPAASPVAGVSARVAEIAARLAAVSGPWKWDEPCNWHGLEARVFIPEPYGVIAQIPIEAWRPRSIGRANACFIAAAPADIAYLLKLAQPSAEGDGWIAVTERDKPTGEDHLLSLEIVEGDAERRVQAVGYFNRLTRSWFINGSDVGELRVDYYRPLPAPPSGQGEVK